jgi:hypothetical protein
VGGGLAAQFPAPLKNARRPAQGRPLPLPGCLCSGGRQTGVRGTARSAVHRPVVRLRTEEPLWVGDDPRPGGGWVGAVPPPELRLGVPPAPPGGGGGASPHDGGWWAWRAVPRAPGKREPPCVRVAPTPAGGGLAREGGIQGRGELRGQPRRGRWPGATAAGTAGRGRPAPPVGAPPGRGWWRCVRDHRPVKAIFAQRLDASSVNANILGRRRSPGNPRTAETPGTPDASVLRNRTRGRQRDAGEAGAAATAPILPSWSPWAPRPPGWIRVAPTRPPAQREPENGIFCAICM